VVEIPFDTSDRQLPWEERRINDLDTFMRFADTVHATLGPFFKGRELVLDRLWPRSVEHLQRTLRNPVTGEPEESTTTRSWLVLGEILARARHGVEQELGLKTWEHPLYLACWFDPFKAFAAHLFSKAHELHSSYNAALNEFRLRNGLHSRSHPVPDLIQDGEWLEMPFWLWWRDEGERRRAFVRRAGKSWELTDRATCTVRPGARSGSTNPIAWEDVELKASLKLRPRALVTTMYARLVLSDLFIHGIGGAKYDEVTDEIIRRFFGIEPPKYITATATFRLPIDRPQVTIEDVRELQQKLRDVRYRPENFLREPLVKPVAGLRDALQALADEKRDYLARHDLRRCKQQVFARLDTINRAMHDLLKPVEQELTRQRAQLADVLRRAQLLGSRDFSFVLFPADELPARLLALSKVSA
jgi:hypothetical protein